MDKLQKAESYGNIPANIGYNPYLGYRWHCTACNSQGTLLAFQLPHKLRHGNLPRGTEIHRCAACRVGKRKIIYKLDKAAALHRNDIFWRETSYAPGKSVLGFD